MARETREEEEFLALLRLLNWESRLYNVVHPPPLSEIVEKTHRYVLWGRPFNASTNPPELSHKGSIAVQLNGRKEASARVVCGPLCANELKDQMTDDISEHIQPEVIYTRREWQHMRRLEGAPKTILKRTNPHRDSDRNALPFSKRIAFVDSKERATSSAHVIRHNGSFKQKDGNRNKYTNRKNSRRRIANEWAQGRFGLSRINIAHPATIAWPTHYARLEIQCFRFPC